MLQSFKWNKIFFYDTIIIMQEKIKKVVIYIAFAAMLAVAVYAIFFNEHVIRSKYYFLVTAAALMFAAAAFLVFLLSGKMERGKRTKLIIVICAVLAAFQIVTLPVVNIFSQTLPVWPPRGTIFQIAGFKNSISQNEVGLTMRYYLGGRDTSCKKRLSAPLPQRGDIYNRRIRIYRG